MSLVAHTRQSRHLGRDTVPIVMVLAAVISAAQVFGVDRAWSACQVFPVMGADRFTLYAVGMVSLTVLNTAIIALPHSTFHRSYRTGESGRWTSAAVAAVLLISETVIIGAMVATPDHVAAISCAGNVPPWWPAWLPS